MAKRTKYDVLGAMASFKSFSTPKNARLFLIAAKQEASKFLTPEILSSLEKINLEKSSISMVQTAKILVTYIELRSSFNI